LRELNQRNINSYALAIEAQAKYIFTPNVWAKSLSNSNNPSELLQSMVKLYEKIKQQ
jgi:nitric oxide reductase NorD protein